MNIDSIQIYSSGSQMKPKHAYHSNEHVFKRESVENCENQKKNSGYYSGSFTGKTEAAATAFNNLGNTFFDKIARSGVFKSLLDVFEDKSSVAQALVALVVAGGIRPVTNLAMANDKDRDDSMYAASHAIASAVIGFVVSSIVLHPFDKAFKKIKDNPKGYLVGLEELLGVEIGQRKLEKSKPYKKLSKMAQMGMDTFVLGVPKAMLTIALIPPILKYVFHMEKGKHKSNAQQNTVQDTQVNNTQYMQKLVKDNPVFKAVEGGVQ